jgi:hypothetical protein
MRVCGHTIRSPPSRLNTAAGRECMTRCPRKRDQDRFQDDSKRPMPVGRTPETGCRTPARSVVRSGRGNCRRDSGDLAGDWTRRCPIRGASNGARDPGLVPISHRETRWGHSTPLPVCRRGCQAGQYRHLWGGGREPSQTGGHIHPEKRDRFFHLSNLGTREPTRKVPGRSRSARRPAGSYPGGFRRRHMGRC